MDQPSDRKTARGKRKQGSVEAPESATSSIPTLKHQLSLKMKCDTLGFYLEKATNLLALSSNQNSGPSSNFSSFKEPSFTNNSCERVEKRWNQRVSMKENKKSLLSAKQAQFSRKSMVSLTPSYRQNGKARAGIKTLKSFDVSPFNPAMNYYMSKDQGKQKKPTFPTITEFERMEENAKKDVNELKEFIELEEF